MSTIPVSSLPQIPQQPQISSGQSKPLPDLPPMFMKDGQLYTMTHMLDSSGKKISWQDMSTSDKATARFVAQVQWQKSNQGLLPPPMPVNSHNVSTLTPGQTSSNPAHAPANETNNFAKSVLTPSKMPTQLIPQQVHPSRHKHITSEQATATPQVPPKANFKHLFSTEETGSLNYLKGLDKFSNIKRGFLWNSKLEEPVNPKECKAALFKLMDKASASDHPNDKIAVGVILSKLQLYFPKFLKQIEKELGDVGKDAIQNFQTAALTLKETSPAVNATNVLQETLRSARSAAYGLNSKSTGAEVNAAYNKCKEVWQVLKDAKQENSPIGKDIREAIAHIRQKMEHAKTELPNLETTGDATRQRIRELRDEGRAMVKEGNRTVSYELNIKNNQPLPPQAVKEIRHVLTRLLVRSNILGSSDPKTSKDIHAILEKLGLNYPSSKLRELLFAGHSEFKKLFSESPLTNAMARIVGDFKFIGPAELSVLKKIPNDKWIALEKWGNSKTNTSEEPPKELVNGFLAELQKGKNLRNPADRFAYENERTLLSYLLRQFTVENLSESPETTGQSPGTPGGMEDVD